MYAVAGAGHADPLPDGAILPKIVHVEGVTHADDIRVGYSTLVPRSHGPDIEDWGGLFAPRAPVLRSRERYAQAFLRARFIPIPKLTAMRQGSAIARDIVARRCA